jgi:hypothetical protein
MNLYTYYRSQASFRVRIALNLKGIARKDSFLHLEKGDQFASAYRAINPQMVVPTLIDGCRTSRPGHAAGCEPRSPRQRNWKFESIPLQRGVTCEPEFADNESRASDASPTLSGSEGPAIPRPKNMPN